MAVTTTDARPRGVAVPRRRRRDEFFGRIGRHWADYLYVLPALVVMLAVIGYPIYYTVYLGFFNTPPGRPLEQKIWVGLDNYKLILQSESFREVTKNTFVWTFFSTLLSFVLGFGAALVVQREFIGRGLVRGILLVPYVISAVAASYIWRWLYHSDSGLISGLLLDLGIIDHRIIFLDDVDRVLPSLIVANVWKEFPFVMIMILAGLQTVPEQLHRAAMVDGAGPFSRFVHVTVPHLKGVIVITSLLLVVTNLNSFTLVWIMTGGGPAGASDLWITQIYQIAFGRTRFGLASAYSVILFFVMMVLGFFYVKALTRSSGRRRPI
jgi:multiple sugar transport system permease protein